MVTGKSESLVNNYWTLSYLDNLDPRKIGQPALPTNLKPEPVVLNTRGTWLSYAQDFG